jgi:5-dehydro-2-deoxygluconokinase
VDIVLGTEDEICASVLADEADLERTDSVSDTKVHGDVEAAARVLLDLGPRALIQKRGEQGARIHLRHDSGEIEVIEAPGYPVEVANILGAGDAFAAGFLCGRLQGWNWRKAARLGNACGAIVVTRHGCANFMPTFEEVSAFVKDRGGLD